MQASTTTKTAGGKSRIHWVGTLSASVVSLFAAARPKPHPNLVTTKHSRRFYRRGVAPWATPDFGMLVASDVSRTSGSMVP